MAKRKIMPLLFILTGVIMMIIPVAINVVEKHKNEARAEAYVAEYKEQTNIATDGVAEEIDYVAEYNRTQSESIYDSLPELLGYVKIEALDITYPIYKTTTEEVLSIGIGHFEGTDIPTAVNGIHAVIVGHNGTYGQEFFSGIGSLVMGDIVEIYISGEILTYEVATQEIVLPDAAEFSTDDDKSLLTLVTCTPYGSNTHRLLVHCELQEKR